MKSLLFICLLFASFNSAFAEKTTTYELAKIRSIDSLEIDRNYVEVSEEGLPPDHYVLLIQMMNTFRFTLIPEIQVRDIFEKLKSNSRARMRRPDGKCSYRRAYIQGLLKKMKMVSGKIVIKCPTNRGRLRLKDQVSGRYFSYSNFHDANIVTVQTNSTPDYRVMDLQFQDAPVSLQEYLTQIEASQKIKPAKRQNGSTKGFCYWSISTPYLTL